MVSLLCSFFFSFFLYPFFNTWSCFFSFHPNLQFFFSTRVLVSFLSFHLSCCFLVFLLLFLTSVFSLFHVLFIYSFILTRSPLLFFRSLVLLWTHGLFILLFLVVRLSIYFSFSLSPFFHQVFNSSSFYFLTASSFFLFLSTRAVPYHFLFLLSFLLCLFLA